MANIPQSVLWQVQLDHNVRSVALLQKALGILERDELRPAPSGNYVAKSKSRERVEYVIDPVNHKCGCLAGQHGILCSHLLAVYLREEEFHQAKQHALATGEPQSAIVDARERVVRTARALRPAIEWLEEDQI